jgi:putative tryptophan/tyrosine transport system substrate-binding protein
MEEIIMTRRLGLLVALVLAMLMAPLSADASSPMTVPRIGFVTGGGDLDSWPLDIDAMPGGFAKAFRQGLRELGYLEGHTVLVEYRGAGGHLDRIPALVAELVRLPVDVLVSGNGPAIRAAKQATTTIPIVMAITADPVAAGPVESLARPGRNLTGLTTLNRRLTGKRLEVLTEVVPGLGRVGLLGDANEPGWVSVWPQYEAAAQALKIPLQVIEVRGPHPDLEGAFQAAVRGGVRALVSLRHSVLSRDRQRVADLALQHRLPSMYEDRTFVDAGGLVSYAAHDTENGRRAAYFVDRILKGVKPADLPVEAPTTFELVINLKTAQALGLTIPPTLLFQAAEVIR